MFSQHVLNYHALENIQFSQIDFISVETAPLTPVVSQGYDDFFKEEKYDTFNFIQQVFTLLNNSVFESSSVPVERLILVCKSAQANEFTLQYESYGFVYLDDFRIIPLTFESSANFEQWINVLKGKAGNEETLFTMSSQSFSGRAVGQPNLFTETDAFLIQHAPKLYRKDIETAKKQAFLKSFQELASMQQSIDVSETAALWQKLAVLKGIDQPPAENVEAAFANFEQITQYPLPAEVQAIYRINNGAPEAFGHLELLPIENVIKEWQNWKMMFDDWTLDELQHGGKAEHNKTLAMYCNPYWIPLIDNISGNYFAVDLMPGENGKIGQIIAFGADEYEINCIADNLNHLLEMTIAMIEDPGLDIPLRRRLYLD